MYDLQLLGVHDDGEHVVFLGADGQRYRAPIDDPLRAAVRRDRARLNQLQVSSQTLRPRDIQALVRAGHSAERIADEAGVPMEFVRRFEGPVLAERENIVWRARQTRLRRRDEVGPALGDLADERLEARGVSLGRGAVWDAWREDDGTWTVQVVFTAGGTERTARWRYDVGASHLTPADDESKWLSSEHAGEQSRRGAGVIRQSRDEASAQHGGALDKVLRRRLETVEFRSPWAGDNGAAEEAAAERAGSGAEDPVREPVPSPPLAQQPDIAAEPEPAEEPAEPEDEGENDVVDLTRVETGSGPAVRSTSADDPDASSQVVAEDVPASTAPRVEPEPQDPTPEAESDGTEPAAAQDDAPAAREQQPSELPPAAHPADSHPEDLPDATVVEPRREQPAAQAEPVIPKPGPRPTRRQTATRKGRASVPSWDDILFGSKKD